MSTPKLQNDRDRAEWLQCLQAATSVEWARSSTEAPANYALGIADFFYEELRKRCER